MTPQDLHCTTGVVCLFTSKQLARCKSMELSLQKVHCNDNCEESTIAKQ